MLVKTKDAKQSNSAWFNSGCFIHLRFAWKPFYDLNFCLHGCLKNVCLNASTFICLVNMWLLIICYSHQITESEQHHCQMPITVHKKQIIKMDRWWIIHRPGSAFPKLPVNKWKTNTSAIMMTVYEQFVNWKKKLKFKIKISEVSKSVSSCY